MEAPSTHRPAPPTSPAASTSPATTAGAVCLRCGYELQGLNTAGACPECGMSISQSLQGDLLKFSSPEYIRSLHLGITMILIAIVATLLTIVASVSLGFAAGVGMPQTEVARVFELVGAGATFLSLVGWWLFTSPDPALSNRDEGASARVLIRFAVIFSAAFSVVSLLVQYLPSLQTAAGTGMVGLIILGGLGLLAGVVQYFASMLYISKIGPRLPDPTVTRKARRLLWLGPLLWTVGIILFMLGPLIALLLYVGLIDLVRKNLKRIGEEQSLAGVA
jgi:hypothetical protein